ncbi:hypothetical protein HMI55_002094, partial [Coelomomyces lativittatus]
MAAIGNNISKLQPSSSPVEKTELLSLQLYDIQTLLLLIKSPESNLCSQVIESIIKFSNDTPQNRQTLITSGIINELLDILVRFKQNSQVKKAAISCLACLTEA